jgi:transcriptional regulator with XRE-family HTH domain
MRPHCYSPEMKRQVLPDTGQETSPGELIRGLRKRNGLTLSELSARTGLAVSTLSKLEIGHVSLSYDKLMTISKGLGVDMAELLDAHPGATNGPAPGRGGRRVVHRASEGQLVETRSYKQLYLATELLNKRITPMVVELRARTMEEFIGEFGDFIRHPGEEFALILEGEVDFCTDIYAPLRLKAGDSIYFDSEMGHAYLKASDATCRLVATCTPRGKDETMIETFVNASEKHAADADAAPKKVPAAPRIRKAR